MLMKLPRDFFSFGSLDSLYSYKLVLCGNVPKKVRFPHFIANLHLKPNRTCEVLLVFQALYVAKVV